MTIFFNPKIIQVLQGIIETLEWAKLLVKKDTLVCDEWLFYDLTKKLKIKRGEEGDKIENDIMYRNQLNYNIAEILYENYKPNILARFQPGTDSYEYTKNYNLQFKAKIFDKCNLFFEVIFKEFPSDYSGNHLVNKTPNYIPHQIFNLPEPDTEDYTNTKELFLRLYKFSIDFLKHRILKDEIEYYSQYELGYREKDK